MTTIDHSRIPHRGAQRTVCEPPAHWGTRRYQEANDRLLGMICAPLVFGLSYVLTTLVRLCVS